MFASAPNTMRSRLPLIAWKFGLCYAVCSLQCLLSERIEAKLDLNRSQILF